MAITDAQNNPQFPGVLDVEPSTVWDQRNDVVLIDVRRSEEYHGELGHIAGASLLTLDELPARWQEIPQDKDVVFVCLSGGRSARAAYFARENGCQQVYNMKGGMLAWHAQQLPVE